MLVFKNKPDLTTPITADNLNNNFNELKKDYIYLKLSNDANIEANDEIPFDVIFNTNPEKFVWNAETHRLNAPAGRYKMSANAILGGSSSGLFSLNIIDNNLYNNTVSGQKVANQHLSLSCSPCVIEHNGVNDIYARIGGGNTLLLSSTYTRGSWMLVEEI